MINGKQIVDAQLGIEKKKEVVFEDGTKTVLTPVKYVPMLDGDGCVSLDGEWKAHRRPFCADETEIVSASEGDGSWETLHQPGKVFYADPEAESRPIENWNRVTLSHIDDEDGAVIVTGAEIPSAWAGKRIFLRFNSIYPAGRVYLDGELLGEHLSGLTPVEFDVTERVRAGAEAAVAVRLLRKHKFAKMDMVRHASEFAGLAQSAFFHAVEPLYVEDYHLQTLLDDTLSKGAIEGAVVLRNAVQDAGEACVTVTVTSPCGARGAEMEEKVTLQPGERKSVPVRMQIERPYLWNDEKPHLYVVCISLDSPGLEPQRHSYRTGFRRLDLSPEGPVLNGSFIKFRGVNHLTYHPRHGMYTPREWLRKNLELMKKANVNAIRTHFLGPDCLADLCDEMGIYLLQELPVDWGTHYIHDPEWVGPAMMRIQGGILRDRHHPSVMVWSVGNENMPESADAAPDGWNHLSIYEQFAKKLDPSRPTMFPPPGPANKIEGIFELRAGDIADIHYSFRPVKEFLRTGRVKSPNSWEADQVEITREEALERGWSGVWFSSEYGISNLLPEVLNGPYLSRISDRPEDPLSGRNTMQVFTDRLREEWGFMRDEPTCLGGAYFSWIAAGSGKGPEGNPWGWVRWAEDADWGVVCGDLTPKPFFWAMRVLFSPVWLPPRILWIKGAGDSLVFEIHNQYNSINLEDCTMRTQFIGGNMSSARSFRDVELECAPGERKEARIPVWDNRVLRSLEGGSPAVCRCTLLDPEDFRVLTHDILIIPEKVAEKMAGPLEIGPDAVDF